MVGELVKQNKVDLNRRLLDNWFEELALPVAPSCNMMCNFCSKCSDCICNGNNPEYLSRPMTPRQAVNWAVSSAERNRRIRIIRISGPGEPLFNNQTFEVLRRLNYEMPEHMYCINTNGLLLEEKLEELVKLNVKTVEVSVNAVFDDTIRKLYSRIISGKGVHGPVEIAEKLLGSQIRGMEKCISKGIGVKVNSVYFPGINDEDLAVIAAKCREMGIDSMCIISGIPNGKLNALKRPAFSELAALQHMLSMMVGEVRIKSFAPGFN